MELKDLIRKDTSELTARVEWRDEIFLTIRYIRKEELERIAKNCRTHRYNKATHTREPDMDYARFLKELCNRVVLKWKGMTLEKLKDIVALNTNDISATQWQQPVEFSQENLAAIAAENSDLEKFISDTCINVSFFRDVPLEEALIKNSMTSPHGS